MLDYIQISKNLVDLSRTVIDIALKEMGMRTTI